ncbi:MAG: cytochrome d ubiquinol oxidase subunit II [Eggerthellaceae bacterium]
MELTLLQIVWFILIGVLLAGYFILDGFDLGAGILYPFVAKTEREKAMVRRSVGPVWDGNEVWLLTAGGALFAAFPAAYATSFSGFYLAIMLVLFALIVRAVSLEFRAHDQKWKKLWDACFFIGSLLPALLFGVALGNIIGCVELNEHGDYIGGFAALLDPFSLLCGLISLIMCILLGASWIAIKTDEHEDLNDRCATMRRHLIMILIILLAIATCMYLARPDVLHLIPVNTIAIVCAIVAFVALLVSWFLCGKDWDISAHIALSVVCVALIGMTAAGIFPDLIPATNPELSITIPGAASSEYTLGAMTIIACIGVPLVVFYQIMVYRIFRGKITDEDIQES